MKTKLSEDLFEDIGDSAVRLQNIISDMVDGRRKLKESQRQELIDFEHEMLTFLWRCRERRLLSTAKMARMIGISRQSLYEKWKQHGFKVDDL